MRRWISLGGWSGPALMLKELGLQRDDAALPFDTIRATFDGVMHFVENGLFDEYYPPIGDRATFRPDALGRSSLGFRAQHTCFLQCDLNNTEVLHELEQRSASWRALFKGNSETPATPVTFLRGVIARDPLEEVQLIPRFHEAVRARTEAKLPFRTVMVLLSEDESAAVVSSAPLCALPHAANPCVVWQLKGNAAALGTKRPKDSIFSAEKTLFDVCHDGLQKVVITMSREMKWKQLESSLPNLDTFVKSASVKGYAGLSEHDGISLFTGTCRGIASTLYTEENHCHFCGSADGHAVRPRGTCDTSGTWEEAEKDSLLLAYGMHGGDEVLAAEAHAKSYDRDVKESYEMLRSLLGHEEEGGEGPPEKKGEVKNERDNAHG